MNPGLGGWQNFVYVCFFRVIPNGGQTHKQVLPKNPGTIPWKMCLCFFFVCFFSQTNQKHKQLLGIVLGRGGGQIVCLCWIFMPWDKKRETHKQISRKSLENLCVSCFLFNSDQRAPPHPPPNDSFEVSLSTHHKIVDKFIGLAISPSLKGSGSNVFRVRYP